MYQIWFEDHVNMVDSWLEQLEIKQILTDQGEKWYLLLYSKEYEIEEYFNVLKLNKRLKSPT